MLPHALRHSRATRRSRPARSNSPAAASRTTAASSSPARCAPRNWRPRLAGKPFSWDQPVNANFAIRRDERHAAARHAQVRIQVPASRGQPARSQQFTANASFDLNQPGRAARPVRRSQRHAAGRHRQRQARLAANRQRPIHRHSDGRAGAASPLSLRDGAVWTEPQLAIRAEAAGVLDPTSHRPTRVDTAKLQVNGQGDALDAQLTGAVGLTECRAGLAGHHSRHRPHRPLADRARPWFAPGDWQIDGQSELTANVRVAGERIRSHANQARRQQSAGHGPGWNINEPRVRIRRRRAVGRRDGRSRRQHGAARHQHRLARCAGRSLSRRRSGHQPTTGVAAFRADLARLAAWRQPANSPRAVSTARRIHRQYALRSTRRPHHRRTERNWPKPGAAQARRDAATRRAGPPAAAAGYQTIWQEPTLTLRGVASYESSADRLAFDQFQIQSNTLQATAGGTDRKTFHRRRRATSTAR